MDLNYVKENVYEKMNDDEIKEMDKYALEYMDFMSKVKTEYEGVSECVKMLEASGFSDILTVKELKKGDKVYFNNKSKSLYAAVIGSDSLVSGTNIIGAHIDSPRIDLKPIPLYEAEGAAFLKTQYYGGIKKYQWLTIPLSMHGVIYNDKNEKIEVCIGEDESDPCFTITDLLPHLGKDQMKLTANEFIDPEKMSILFGSFKLKSDNKEENTIKNNILKLLNDKYGIKEFDFARSELHFVPAFKPRFVGLDKSMIGAYGHDDRICSYATIKSISKLKNVKKTAIAMIVDKEEIGSFGNTSMSSNTFDMFMNKLIKLTNEKDTDLFEVYYNSKMLSSDVSSCIDPLHTEVFDVQNGNKLGFGVTLEKYTGSGGKYNSSDANADFVSYVTNLFERNNVMFQMGTLGKIEKGGGGTIAYILAAKGVDVIDVGTPVLCMHSPFEIVSKADTYMTYKSYNVFYNEELK